MKHEMRLNAKPFKKIKDGEKTVELRLYDEKRRGISVGDIIVFTCRESGERLEKRVKALHVFADFKQLYAALDLLKCGYAPQEIAAARAEDMEEYYSKAEQERCGVVGIELENIKILERSSSIYLGK